MSKSTPKPEAKPSRSSVTREQLVQAAKLRAEGATWDQIREATGAKLGSSGWFRAWERENVEHTPAGQRVTPKAENPAPAAKPKPAAKNPDAKKSAARK